MLDNIFDDCDFSVFTPAAARRTPEEEGWDDISIFIINLRMGMHKNDGIKIYSKRS